MDEVVALPGLNDFQHFGIQCGAGSRGGCTIRVTGNKPVAGLLALLFELAHRIDDQVDVHVAFIIKVYPVPATCSRGIENGLNIGLATRHCTRGAETTPIRPACRTAVLFKSWCLGAGRAPAGVALRTGCQT
ncbi:hypothetical protein D3C84_991960 [compost metagenome]